MADRRAMLAPRSDAGRATAENGVVLLDGPDGVAVTMTADAAARTADSLLEAARQARGITAGWTAASLARHTQTVIQGAFVLAKAGNDPALAREGLDHLDRYIRHLFHLAEEDAA